MSFIPLFHGKEELLLEGELIGGTLLVCKVFDYLEARYLVSQAMIFQPPVLARNPAITSWAINLESTSR
jgi:hypothetical protein